MSYVLIVVMTNIQMMRSLYLTSLVYTSSNASSSNTRDSIRNCSERSINNSKSLFMTPKSAE